VDSIGDVGTFGVTLQPAAAHRVSDDHVQGQVALEAHLRVGGHEGDVSRVSVQSCQYSGTAILLRSGAPD